jgi:SAM-dependent methyltransferase
MSVNGKESSGAPRIAPALLAEAMRAGLEARSHPQPHPHAGADVVTLLSEVFPQLQGYAGLINHPPVVKPGPLAPVMRFLRRGLRALLRPWLEFQTRFNQLALNQVNHHRAQVNDNLGRLDKRLREVGKRLDRAEQRLDDKDYYTAYVNRELTDRGKISQAGLWFNPPMWVQVQEGEARLVAVTERIVEHIFVHTRLPKPPARVLDLGCAESTNSLEMASLGFDVVGVDLRPLPLRHPNFRMLLADIGNLPLPDASFDVVVSLSTIEHVGLDWYTPSPDGTSDHRVVAEVERLLKPGGRFLLTVPFGQHVVTPVHRVYNRAMLDALLAPLKRVETAFAVRDGDSWCWTNDAERAGRADSAKRVSAVALVVAEKN